MDLEPHKLPLDFTPPGGSKGARSYRVFGWIITALIAGAGLVGLCVLAVFYWRGA